MAPKCFHLSQQKDPNSEHLDKSCICVSHNWDHILRFFCDCCYTTKLNMQPHIPGGSFCIAAILQLGLRMFKSLTIINFCAMSLKAFIGFFSWTLQSYFIVSLVPAPYWGQYNNGTIQLFLHWLGSVIYLYNYCFHVGANIPNLSSDDLDLLMSLSSISFPVGSWLDWVGSTGRLMIWLVFFILVSITLAMGGRCFRRG